MKRVYPSAVPARHRKKRAEFRPKISALSPGSVDNARKGATRGSRADEGVRHTFAVSGNAFSRLPWGGTR
jgi:hypothetical protein